MKALLAILLAAQALITGTNVLTAYTDDSAAVTAPCPGLGAVSAPAGKLDTAAKAGGSDITSVTVRVGGAVTAPDIDAVYVYYSGAIVNTIYSPTVGQPLTIPMPGQQKGGAPLHFELYLNPSAAGKTYTLEVTAVTGTTDTYSLLPATTALRDVLTPSC